MKVTKEEKALYRFLSMISNILKNDNGEGILFVEKGLVYFVTWYIAGYVDIKQNEKLVYEFMQDELYSITRTLKQDFVLEKINEENLKENKKEENRMMKARIKNAVVKGRYMCRIDREETCVISKISNETNKFIKDSYLGLMKNLKESDVYENDHFITLEHEERIEKENTFVKTVIALFCEKTKETEFNQNKMEV